MFRLTLILITSLLLLCQAVPAAADPADIEAAARGVVRVVVIERDGGKVTPVSHGTGFAVAPEMVVTNAHVVAEALDDPSLVLGIVPSDGGDAVFAKLVTVSKRNDLALLTTTAPMHLPPLTIAGNPPTDAGAVTAVGYPQNVDRAQGLALEDIFRPQPPVTSTGFLSGRRPSREFDTLLHTAPIARGSSGGPLLDACGRVLGVNSFGAQSGGADAEFFFAVSTRELLPFLRANSVTPRVNGMPCRSLAEVDQAERARVQQQRAAAEAQAAIEERALATRRDEAREEITFAVLARREDLMALAFVLLLVAAGAGAIAWRAHEAYLDEELDEDLNDDGAVPDRRFNRATLIAGGIALLALAGAAGAWAARPGFTAIGARLETRLREQMASSEQGPIAVKPANGALTCTLAADRSRIIGEAEAQITLDWSAGGCVNGRTQYGPSGGAWSRVLVPANEASVSVNRYDPATGEYVVERYLLDNAAMQAARAARAKYEAPSCTASSEEAQALGRNQQGLVALLPSQPNERLVYDCAAQ